LVQSMVESVRVTAPQCEVHLDCALPANLPQTQGDPIQLERVLGNLLDNAISYTPCEGRIEVAAVGRDGMVEVSVTDTGPGVPPEHREDIFERFTRVPGVEGRKKGYGLGLYSCRQIVEAHGGRIWVEPGPQGVGSRFVFTLPVDTGQRHA
jgi:signal transduction histidine kinase